MAVQGTSDFLVPVVKAGTAAVAAGVLRLVLPFTATLLGATVTADTAPVGADILVDVNINGTTVFTDQTKRPKVVDGTNVSRVKLATPAALAVGDYITVDVDQIGSLNTEGTNLMISLWLDKV